jgi:hypothetical protein
MYGMIPNATTENLSRAPPENILNMSNIDPRCCSKRAFNATGFIPGTGMCVQILKTNNAPNRKKILCRSSVIFPS